jgi:hypothetical protein
MPKGVIMFKNKINVNNAKCWIDTAYNVNSLDEGPSEDNNYVITINFGYISFKTKNYYLKLKNIVAEKPIQSAQPFTFGMVDKHIRIEDITSEIVNKERNLV